jgi:hypothetical protein
VANKRGFRLGSGNTLLYVDKEGDEENDANEEIDDEEDEDEDSDDELQAVVGE